MTSRALTGVFRSLRLYHGAGAPKAEMDALYRLFVAPDALVFDIGAHVGDRVSSFRRLGARVVAFEPQPLLHRALRLIHGQDPNVVVRADAVAPERGPVAMRINTANPTVSTLSDAFIGNAKGQHGWTEQTWDEALVVHAITLDDAIGRFGQPAFVKIDVEGFEAAVLQGLSDAIPVVSFEFTTIARPVAMACMERLADLGDYEFNVALGETQTLAFSSWLTREDMARHLMELPQAANSGDVYARRLSPTGSRSSRSS